MVKEPMTTPDQSDAEDSASSVNTAAMPHVTMPEGLTPTASDQIVPDESFSNGASHESAADSSSFMTAQRGAVAAPRIQVAASSASKSSEADTIVKMSTSDLNLHYGTKHALKSITTTLPQGSITALIGPSGCGKSTFLRCLNRMNDLIEGCKITGDVSLEGENVYARGVDVVNLRQRVGMVFQKPNPFPMSIFDNIAYGPRLRGLKNKGQLTQLVEESLQGAALWDEVKDDLKKSALSLSGGQQQRLCIARALATKPEVVLMDEPASALDPISTLKIEELMRELRDQYTIVIVTHNMQQAARVSDYTGFFLIGELVEMDVTSKIFTDPSDQRTEDYITGRFG